MRRDEWAVSDVVGSILLVGITVTSFAALGLLVANIPAPPNNIHAELSVTVHPGADQSWATGDESVVVRHLYGESIPEEGSWIGIAINGVGDRIKGADLDFSGDTLDIGEFWTRTMIVSFNDEISVDVVIPRGGGSKLLSSTSLVTGQTSCQNDNDPPHAIITQVPSNLEALTGDAPVTITALLVDICSNVDALNDPILEHWFGAEAHGSIVMTPQGNDRWVATVAAPVGGWVAKATKEFQYSITSMQDSLGNLGNSPTRTDYIEPFPPTYYYVTNRTAILGDIAEFPKMQNASDGGAASKLSEALPPGGTGTVVLYGQALSSVAGSGNGQWSNTNNALGDTGGPAIYKKDDDPSLNYLRIEMADTPPSTDQIIAVKLVVQGKTTPDKPLINNNDGWRLQACWTGLIVTGSSCNQKSGVLLNAPPDAEGSILYDITDKKPGGGAWSWADINKVDLLVNGQIVGGIRDGDWKVTNVRLEVTHGPGYNMEHELVWQTPTVVTVGNLEFNYYTNGGSFQVEVWDWAQSQWNARTNQPLGAISSTTWIDSLTLNEWNSGDPRIRIVSAQTDATKQAQLYIDYARLAV